MVGGTIIVFYGFMLKDFRAYQIAVQFYKICETVRGPKHLVDQLQRASSSIALNLAEGSESGSNQNRRRYYRMAMASLRESQAILDLVPTTTKSSEAAVCGEKLGGHIFKLCQFISKQLERGAGGREPGPENR